MTAKKHKAGGRPLKHREGRVRSITVSLPVGLVKRLDRAVGKGSRSEYVADLVRGHLAEQAK